MAISGILIFIHKEDMVEYQFSPYQIAEFAMGIEEAGMAFYETLAAASDDAKIKSIFTALSKAESGHKAVFKRIADSLRNAAPEEYSVDISSLVREDIDSLRDAAFNLRSFPEKPRSIQDAIAVAIHTEEEAIRIYTQMRDTFIERFNEVFSSVLNEEKKHLEILSGLAH